MIRGPFEGRHKTIPLCRTPKRVRGICILYYMQTYQVFRYKPQIMYVFFALLLDLFNSQAQYEGQDLQRQAPRPIL